MTRKAMGASTTKEKVKDSKSKMKGSAKDKKTAKAEAHYPTVSEPMIVHPWNNSSMKIRDNGVIDMFSDTDNGIRINPVDKTIDLFTKKINEHTSFIRSFVKKDEQRDIGGKWTINCTTATINTKKNTTINAKGNIAANAKGNVAVDAQKNVSVKAKGNINFTAGKEIYYKAGGQHHFS